MGRLGELWPQQESGRSKQASHHELRMTAAEWDAYLDDVQRTRETFGVRPAEQAELKALVASTRARSSCEGECAACASRLHAALARSRDLTLADVSAEDEAAMPLSPVRRKGIFWHRVAASLFHTGSMRTSSPVTVGVPTPDVAEGQVGGNGCISLRTGTGTASGSAA
jgi:hypothetical protein